MVLFRTPVRLPDLSQRQLRGELMDDPSLDVKRHRQALDGLRRINLVTNSYAPLWGEIQQVAFEQTAPLRILDVGCGSGDSLFAIGQRAQQAGVDVELHGIDISPTALETVHERSKSKGIEVNCRQQDVLSEPDLGRYDVVYCSLFLHHFTNEAAKQLMTSME